MSNDKCDMKLVCKNNICRYNLNPRYTRQNICYKNLLLRFTMYLNTIANSRINVFIPRMNYLSVNFLKLTNRFLLIGFT